MILTKLPDWLSECALSLAALTALAFILNRLGLMAWFSWTTRRGTKPAQHSSAKKFRSVHE